MKLSIIIPCYNEKQTIEKIVSKILKVKIKKEIIIDDFSNDGSSEIIKKISGPNIKKIFHKKIKVKEQQSKVESSIRRNNFNSRC